MGARFHLSGRPAAHPWGISLPPESPPGSDDPGKPYSPLKSTSSKRTLGIRTDEYG